MKVAIRDYLTGLFLTDYGESPDWEDATDYKSAARAMDLFDRDNLLDYEIVAKLGYHSSCELVICRRLRDWHRNDPSVK